MNVNEVINGIQRLPLNASKFERNSWVFHIARSHILSSQCTRKGAVCSPNGEGDNGQCQFCYYTQNLNLPHLPDMVFASNIFTLFHSQHGVSIAFNAFDALGLVSNGKQTVEISCAEEWREYRTESGHTEKVFKPFDWTFSTNYKGTLCGPWEVEDSQQRIDLERLKKKDEILFFDEITLFEDELHDNGIAQLSIKMRVMPEVYYVLMRYFLRVDNVLIKINDTRFYHEFDTDYVIREFTSREAKIPDLKVPPPVLLDPNEISRFLPLIQEVNEKLNLPKKL